MWHKAIWKGHPMRLELTRVGLLVELANHYTTCVWDLKEAQISMPRTHIWDEFEFNNNVEKVKALLINV